MGTFGDWADLVHGPVADWGHLNCGCHPNRRRDYGRVGKEIQGRDAHRRC